MTSAGDNGQYKILILASISGGYAGADSVGQAHLDYAPNTYIFPVVSPVIFSEDFYLESFEKGIDAILVMFSGTDSPFKGDSERTAQIINNTYTLMKERGIDTKRLRLVAICTVCTKPFLKEVGLINGVLNEIGFVRDEIAAAAAGSPPAQ
jgi:coenzyme F420-reducing hydrogenase delta subunit